MWFPLPQQLQLPGFRNIQPATVGMVSDRICLTNCCNLKQSHFSIDCEWILFRYLGWIVYLLNSHCNWFETPKSAILSQDVADWNANVFSGEDGVLQQSQERKRISAARVLDSEYVCVLLHYSCFIFRLFSLVLTVQTSIYLHMFIHVRPSSWPLSWGSHVYTRRCICILLYCNFSCIFMVYVFVCMYVCIHHQIDWWCVLCEIQVSAMIMPILSGWKWKMTQTGQGTWMTSCTKIGPL